MLIIVVTTFYSCKKETSPCTNCSSRQFSISSFFKLSQPAMQNFNINAGQFASIIGAKGTKVFFYPTTFKNKNGQVVSSGTVTIVLQEMLKGADMILANKTTTSDGKLLQSGGQILLKAYQNNEELFINAAAKPTVKIPASNSAPMNLFYGNVTANDTLAGDSTINWTPADTSGQVTILQDSFGLYNFQIDSFTYINCDYFYGSGQPLTDVSVVVPTQYVDSNTAVFIFFPTINSVSRFHEFNATTHTFNLGWGYKIPIGLSAKIVVVSQIGSQYYYDMQAVTISNGLSINSTPAASTLTNIQSQIAAL